MMKSKNDIVRTDEPLFFERSALPATGLLNELAEVMHTRDITTRSLTLRSESIDEDERSVEAILATELPTTVADWANYRIIDEILLVRGVELPDQIPLLDNHQRWSNDNILGSWRNLRREGEAIVGRMFFVEGDEVAERAWNKVRQGHLTDVSVGYAVREYTDIAPGETKRVNGKSYTAGARTLRISSKWKAREGSLVPIGADEAAKIRAMHSGPQETKTMPERLRKYLESIGLRKDATEADAWSFMRGLDGDDRTRANGLMGDAQMPAPSAPATPAANAPDPAASQRATAPAATPQAESAPPVESPDDVARRAVREERERCSAIRGMGAGVESELVERAINDGWTTARASQEFLANVQTNRTQPLGAGAPAAHTGRANGTLDDQRRALTAGVLLRTGEVDWNRMPVPDSVRDETAQKSMRERMANDGHRFSDYSLCEIMRECAAIEGRPVHRDPSEAFREAVSTATFSHVFTQTIGTMVSVSFEETEDTTRLWCEEGETNNFTTKKDVTLGATGGLKRLPRGGTADHATLDDDAETFQIARFAEKFVLDEQDIIDDVFNILAELPMELGRSAAQLRPDLVYSILLANADLADGTALFHGDHANLGEAGTALAAASLKAGITAMGKQRRNGRPLNIPVRHILVPVDLQFLADQLITSAETRDSAAAAEVGTRNVLQDVGLKRVSDDRLGVNGVIDPRDKTVRVGTATNWFLATQRRTIKVMYRTGTGRRPVVRQKMLDGGQWGMSWDINLDLGAYARDFRGMRKHTGAS